MSSDSDSDTEVDAPQTFFDETARNERDPFGTKLSKQQAFAEEKYERVLENEGATSPSEVSPTFNESLYLPPQAEQNKSRGIMADRYHSRTFQSARVN